MIEGCVQKLVVFGVLLMALASERARASCIDFEDGVFFASSLVNHKSKAFAYSGLLESDELSPLIQSDLSINLSRCQRQHAEAHLVLALQPDHFSPLGRDTRQHFFDGVLPTALSCRLQNSPFERTQDFVGERGVYRNQHKFLQSCLELTVESPELTASQIVSVGGPGCVSETLGPGRIRIQTLGAPCAVPLSLASSMELGVRVSPACERLESLKRLGLEPQDVSSLLAFYLSDRPAQGEGLEALKAIAVRVATLPGQVDPRPQWFSTWAGDVYPGKIDWQVRTERNRTRQEITYRPLIQNLGVRMCAGAHCFQTSHYPLVFGAEAAVMKRSASGNYEVISRGRLGGVVPGQFQGHLGMPQSSPRLSWSGELQPGDIYRVEVLFRNPQADLLRSVFRSGGQAFRPAAPGYDGRALRIDPFPTLEAFEPKDFSELIAEFPAFTPDLNIGFFRRLGLTNDGIRRDLWPVRLNRFCGPDDRNGASLCFSAGGGQRAQSCFPGDTANGPCIRLAHEFRVRAYDPVTEQVLTENLGMSRQSNFLPSWQVANPELMPQYQCDNF